MLPNPVEILRKPGEAAGEVGVRDLRQAKFCHETFPSGPILIRAGCGIMTAGSQFARSNVEWISMLGAGLKKRLEKPEMILPWA
jgi:hypothetical protein